MDTIRLSDKVLKMEWKGTPFFLFFRSREHSGIEPDWDKTLRSIEGSDYVIPIGTIAEKDDWISHVIEMPEPERRSPEIARDHQGQNNGHRT
jgi:hypothetical protein